MSSHPKPTRPNGNPNAFNQPLPPPPPSPSASRKDSRTFFIQKNTASSPHNSIYTPSPQQIAPAIDSSTLLNKHPISPRQARASSSSRYQNGTISASISSGNGTSVIQALNCVGVYLTHYDEKNPPTHNKSLNLQKPQSSSNDCTNLPKHHNIQHITHNKTKILTKNVNHHVTTKNSGFNRIIASKNTSAPITAPTTDDDFSDILLNLDGDNFDLFTKDTSLSHSLVTSDFINDDNHLILKPPCSYHVVRRNNLTIIDTSQRSYHALFCLVAQSRISYSLYQYKLSSYLSHRIRRHEKYSEIEKRQEIQIKLRQKLSNSAFSKKSSSQDDIGPSVILPDRQIESLPYDPISTNLDINSAPNDSYTQDNLCTPLTFPTQPLPPLPDEFDVNIVQHNHNISSQITDNKPQQFLTIDLPEQSPHLGSESSRQHFSSDSASVTPLLSPQFATIPSIPSRGLSFPHGEFVSPMHQVSSKPPLVISMPESPLVSPLSSLSTTLQLSFQPVNPPTCSCDGIDPYQQCSVKERQLFLYPPPRHLSFNQLQHSYHRTVLKTFTITYNLHGVIPTQTVINEILPSSTHDLYVITLQECGRLTQSLLPMLIPMIFAAVSFREEITGTISTQPSPHNHETPPIFVSSINGAIAPPPPNLMNHAGINPQQNNILTKFNNSQYSVITAHHLGPTYTIVLIRTRLFPHVSGITKETVSTGIGDFVANKGGAALRFFIGNTSVCCIGAHFNSGHENVEQRHQDYHKIAGRLTLGLNDTVITNNVAENRTTSQNASLLPQTAQNVQFGKFSTSSKHLFLNEHNYTAIPARYRQFYHSSNQFRSDIGSRSDVTIFLADFNYRISGTKKFVENSLVLHRHVKLLHNDQLINARDHGSVFYGYDEGYISFAPTYKYDKQLQCYDTSAKQRIPAWTDRIMWRCCCSNCLHVSKHSFCDCSYTDNTGTANNLTEQTCTYTNLRSYELVKPAPPTTPSFHLPPLSSPTPSSSNHYRPFTPHEPSTTPTHQSIIPCNHPNVEASTQLPPFLSSPIAPIAPQPPSSAQNSVASATPRNIPIVTANNHGDSHGNLGYLTTAQYMAKLDHIIDASHIICNDDSNSTQKRWQLDASGEKQCDTSNVVLSDNDIVYNHNRLQYPCEYVLLERYGSLQGNSFSDHRPVFAEFLLSVNLRG